MIHVVAIIVVIIISVIIVCKFIFPILVKTTQSWIQIIGPVSEIITSAAARIEMLVTLVKTPVGGMLAAVKGCRPLRATAGRRAELPK